MANLQRTNPKNRTVELTRAELELLVDGLHALEYWDYATELDLPRRNGQVFLPEDDETQWAHTQVGADEANAMEQIRLIRRLRQRLDIALTTG